MMSYIVVAILVVVLLGAWSLGYSPLQLWRAGVRRIRRGVQWSVDVWRRWRKA